MSRVRLLPFLALVAALWTAGCLPPAPPTAPPPGPPGMAPTPQPISLGVGFIPNVQFAPFYTGIAKDFFQEEGIDLSLAYGFENDYLKLVGTGELRFMIGSGDQVVLGRAQGLPVRYVMNWYSRYPVVVFARADAGIRTAQDLAGKRIGIPGPFGATYVALRILLDAAGLGEEDVQLESIGFTQAQAVAEGRVDAAVDYAVNGPVILAQQGVAIVQIPLDEYVQIPANGLVTNERTLEQEPDLVRRMVRASLRALQYTLEHPDEAFEIALRFVPEAGGENRAINRAVFDASLDYWRARPGLRLGETTAEEWQRLAELMQTLGFVDVQVDPESLYTHDFLP